MRLTSIHKKRLISFLSIGVIVGGALGYGCSDDENTTPPVTTTDGGSKDSSTTTGTKDSGGGDSTTTADTGTDSGGSATAVANITTTTDGGVTGTATFTQTGAGPVSVTINISGASAGQHGMHIHANGACGEDDAGVAGGAAGGHWNLSDGGHGYPDATPHHTGDMGNITIDDAGAGTLSLTSSEWTIDPTSATNSVVGHAVIFHANMDDGVNVASSGPRQGCGVIQKQ
jgi:superoxide dismutase, Cu-Zn family